jgi:hypothetical protein
MNPDRTLLGSVFIGLCFAVAFFVTGHDLYKWISGAFAIFCFILMGYIIARREHE